MEMWDACRCKHWGHGKFGFPFSFLSYLTTYLGTDLVYRQYSFSFSSSQPAQPCSSASPIERSDPCRQNGIGGLGCEQGRW